MSYNYDDNPFADDPPPSSHGNYYTGGGGGEDFSSYGQSSGGVDVTSGLESGQSQSYQQQYQYQQQQDQYKQHGHGTPQTVSGDDVGSRQGSESIVCSLCLGFSDFPIIYDDFMHQVYGYDYDYVDNLL